MALDSAGKSKAVKRVLSPGFLGFLLFAGWSLAVAVSYFWNGQSLDHHVNAMAISQAKSAYEKDIQYRIWSARHGGVYVPVTDQTPPNPYLADVVPERDIVTPSGRKLTLVNPAYMTRQVFEIANHRNGMLGHITSLNPIRPENVPDEWEANALRSFEAGHESAAGLALIEGRTFMRYMEPLSVKESCMSCHEKQGYEVGDVRGGLSVSVPMGPHYEALAHTQLQMGMTHAIVWFLGSSLILFGTHRLGHVQSSLLQEVEQRRLAEAKAHAERDKQVRLVEELRSAQDQLVQSEKLSSLGLMAAGVAHEINNPVGYVKSNINSLEQYIDSLKRMDQLYQSYFAASAKEDQQIQELQLERDALDIDYICDDSSALLKESGDGLERVRQIVSDLKNFARMDQKETVMVDVHHCIEAALNIAKNELKYKCEIIKEFTELPEIPLVETQVVQVFMNLLVNAAHAIDKQGTITIRTADLDERISVQFEDTGCGIEAQALRKIFEPFYTSKPVGAGTGLGLSVSLGLIESHGGDINVTSTPGVGTRFEVLLPKQAG